MTAPHSTRNVTTAFADPTIDASSTSVERLKHSTGAPPSAHGPDEDQDDPEGWDTANEGTVEGDGAADEDDEPPMSPEERERRRRLKGKAVEVASDGDDDLPNRTPNHRDLNANPQRANGRPHPRHFSTPPPLASSAVQGSSAASSAPIVNGNRDHPALPPPRPPGPPRRSHSTPYQEDSEGQMLAVPAIPSVNVIPTSPPPNGRAVDSRTGAGSLDIPHTLTESSSQESLRRSETLGATSAAERRNNRRRSFDPRRGSNRLSGFFSNLLHLRDRSEPTASEPQAASTPSPPASTAAPRPSSSRSNVAQPGSLQPLKPLQPPSSESLQPVERPPTPPPAMPAPSLRELGLHMTALTPTLTAPQFPSLPVSGVFLAPHYLLLCHNQGLDVMPLNGSLPPQPYALIRRVAFKSVLVMEERGVLVAIAGRREGVRVYSLDEVRKAVEWRIHAELEKERERQDGMGGEWEHVQKAFFGSTWPVQPEDGKEDSPISSGLPSKLSIDNPNDGPRLRGVSAPFVSTQPAQPAQEAVPSPRPRRSSLPPSPPPPYLSLTPTASPSEPTFGQTSNSTATPTAPSQPTSQASPYNKSPDTLAVPEEAAGPSRTRNPSISTVSPPTPAHTVVPPTNNDEDEQANEKGKGVDRTGGALADDDKELERSVDSDDEALDPVAAGPSASAALDERTSAMAAAAAAAEAGSMLVSPVESNERTPSIRRPSVSASLASRRQARPSNLDLSPSALGAPSANLPVVASPAPTLRSMRQALSHSDTVRRPVLAPRSPRASTSLSLSGVEDGTPDSPTEVGEDFISFAQALAESRLPSIPPSGSNPNRSSTVPLVVKPAIPASSIISALAASRNSMSSSQPDFNTSLRLGNPPIPTPPPVPPVPPVPTETAQAAKKRRRFSMVPFGKASASGGNRNNRTSMMPLAAASASTPNLMEPGPSSAQANGSFSPPAVPRPFSGLPEPLPPPSAPASVGRSQSNSSLVPGDGASSSGPARRSLMPGTTVDRIFGPQTAPNSPMKTSRSATSFHSTGSGNANSPASPPSPRASRRFLPKLFTGFKKHHEARNSKDLSQRQRSEAEKRLAAGGAASAAAMSAPMLGNPGPIVPPGRVNDAAAMHMTIVQAPPPKLEYVKLPGTKGAIAIKAVETAKKSFLAILCGEAGEKIELFAGTYRTALGLSRTFILPDSPRSLELQLQGDDLVELFLVFAQNVFALEPATVRVREVRINRAERRAARRRAREARNLMSVDNPEAAPTPEEVPPSETIITSVVTVGTDPTPRNRLSTAPMPGASTSPSEVADFNNGPPTSPLPNTDGPANDVASTTVGAQLPTGTTPEELAALAAVAQFGPYTTFQQLSYAPAFPLGTIADDYIIPPTYPDFLDYREHHEPDAPSISEVLAAPNTPPTLGRTPSVPVPAPVPSQPSAPPKWFYVDPKGVIQGPWKSTLMQTWFDDGFLPPDLPVRRDTETEYTPLKVLCATAKHPDLPFRPPTPPPTPPPELLPVPNVLLHPISILEQPRRFGPPALFYTSRGGHSTSIVDSKGKSVLRGRIQWTPDDETTKLGDVKRLEAFDTRNRAVLLALRHGGIEVVDVGDALCFPGDESRPILPHFHVDGSTVSRRPPFTWRLGSQFNAAGQIISSSDLPSTISSRENPKRSTLLSGRKTSTGPAASSRPASRSDGTGGEDFDGLLEEEVLYLGRHRDVVYFCERNAGSFRIISLGTLES